MPLKYERAAYEVEGYFSIRWKANENYLLQ